MSWVDDFSFCLSPLGQPILTSKKAFFQADRVHSDEQFPEMEGAEIAFFGIAYPDGHELYGSAAAVRAKLYNLQAFGNLSAVDLGDIVVGDSIDDLHHAVKTVCASLLGKTIIPVCLAGSQEVTYAMYSSFERLDQVVNLAIIDAIIDLGEFRDDINRRNYLSKIVLHDPGFLFNLSVLAYQTYLNDAESLELMEKLFFDVYRLGNINTDVKQVEPLLRNADLISFDINAVKGCDSPGTGQPNGLTGEQACQMARYAGISDKASGFGVFNFCHERDHHGQSAMLIAQMLWYFCDGFVHRQKEFPHLSKKQFLEFQVHLDEGRNEMTFYKSKRTEKWWINVPYSGKGQNRLLRHHIVPCSQADYEWARQGEVPDIWWKTYQKLG